MTLCKDILVPNINWKPALLVLEHHYSAIEAAKAMGVSKSAMGRGVR
ncbi:conserved hypothetical protein [Xenorhabdus innexi]|uniref:Transposase n=1 Tax=Xenorhabdus innexi TaxID=290109 RepID=A0A1N6MT96_9GAMM|nr:conserved hypothetical protein [Xenorhabdus innexi]